MTQIVEQIRALTELAGVDGELRSLEDVLESKRTELAAMTVGLSKLETELQGERAHLAAAERTRNDAALELRSMMTQIEHSRDKLNRCRTERESNAAQREVEELRKLLKDREDDVQKLTIEVEASRTQIEKIEEQAAGVRGELSEKQGGLEAQVADLEKDLAAKKAVRDPLTKKVPPPVFRRYEMVRQKRGTGLSSTTDGTCKACNMALPPQLFHRLRREPLVEQCPSCNRLIFFVEKVVAPPGGES